MYIICTMSIYSGNTFNKMRLLLESLWRIFRRAGAERKASFRFFYVFFMH